MNSIKQDYLDELEPLIASKAQLQREISDLRDTRNLYIEESTALSAKNDELTELHQRLLKKQESLQEGLSRARPPTAYLKGHKMHISGSPSLSSLATASLSTLHDVAEDAIRGSKLGNNQATEATAPATKNRFKWYKSSKGPETAISAGSISKPLGIVEKPKTRPSHEVSLREHAFQPQTILRFSKCEYCGEKMWGLQELRCTGEFFSVLQSTKAKS